MQNELKTYKLYHKISPKGLNYLGVTTNSNPKIYRGNGKYWKLHLKANKIIPSQVKTIILFETTSFEEIRKAGIYYSKLYNIVESDLWANLTEETGDGAALGKKLTEEHKQKISLGLKGHICSASSVKIRADKWRGRKHKPETILKLSLAKSGKIGHKHTQISKDKIRQAKIGKLKSGVKVIHIESGEIFNSITKAALKFKLNKTTLTKHIKCRKINCPFKYYDENYKSAFRIGNKGYKFSEEAKKNMKDNNGMAIKVRYKETGQIFNSITEAANYIGMKGNSLTAQLKNKRKCLFEYYNE